MDGAVVVPQEPASIEASKLSAFLRAKGDANRRMIMEPPPPACGTGRTSLSDISNLAKDSRRTRPVGHERGIDKAAQPTYPLDSSARLIKENTALLEIVAERNQMIETSNIEMQKLRVTLQKTNQQNWQLARANSQMLAELNLGKDRLKNMQHELGCVSALLQAKTIELEEIKKHINHRTQPNTIEHQHKNDVVGIAKNPCDPASQKKSCNPTRKRPLRSQSLGSGVAAVLKENDEHRRQSLRRKSSNLKSKQCEPNLKSKQCEPKEELFEIDDIEFPIRSKTSEKSAHEEKIGATSADVISGDNITKPAKIEVHEEGSGSAPAAGQHQVSRRSSLRPSRKVAEKVTCYKEIPLNIKMRRE